MVKQPKCLLYWGRVDSCFFFFSYVLPVCFCFCFCFFLWVTSHYPALWDWNNPLNNVCAFIFTSKCLYWVTIHCTGLYIVEVTSKRRNKGVSQEIPASYTFLPQEAFNSNKRQREYTECKYGGPLGRPGTSSVEARLVSPQRGFSLFVLIVTLWLRVLWQRTIFPALH